MLVDQAIHSRSLFNCHSLQQLLNAILSLLKVELLQLEFRKSFIKLLLRKSVKTQITNIMTINHAVLEKITCRINKYPNVFVLIQRILAFSNVNHEPGMDSSLPA